MTADQWLRTTTKILEQAGIGTARLDCLVLLEDITNKDRAYLLAHPETKLSDKQLEKLGQQIEKRKKHVPLAQIRGKTEFYGHEFIINKDVLEPRPESETMVDILLNLDIPNDTEVIDVGTGSGALGITTKLLLSDTNVTLIDINDACLDVAKQNVLLHKVNVAILKSDLLSSLKFDPSKGYVLLCNLPYVPENYEINEAAMNEPRLAIFGGKDGLDVYRRLFEQIVYSDISLLYLCCESLPFQHNDLSSIASKHGYKQLKKADFIQIFVPS